MKNKLIQQTKSKKNKMQRYDPKIEIQNPRSKTPTLTKTTISEIKNQDPKIDTQHSISKKHIQQSKQYPTIIYKDRDSKFKIQQNTQQNTRSKTTT